MTIKEKEMFMLDWGIIPISTKVQNTGEKTYGLQWIDSGGCAWGFVSLNEAINHGYRKALRLAYGKPHNPWNNGV